MEQPQQKPFTDYDDENTAVANFHSKMGGAMKNDKYASELLMVISNTGYVIENKYYVRPIPMPEPEVNAEA